MNEFRFKKTYVCSCLHSYRVFFSVYSWVSLGLITQVRSVISVLAFNGFWARSWFKAVCFTKRKAQSWMRDFLFTIFGVSFFSYGVLHGLLCMNPRIGIFRNI